MEIREESGYKRMWLFSMFDLPMVTKQEKKEYSQFRKCLLKEGFQMIQFSVYAIYCVSETESKKYVARIKAYLPPDGEVRFMSITEKQFDKMERYLGKTSILPENKPTQLLLF